MAVIKLLPPLMIGDLEVETFLTAFDDVMTDAARPNGLAADFGKTLMKQATHPLLSRRSPRRGRRSGPSTRRRVQGRNVTLDGIYEATAARNVCFSDPIVASTADGS